MISRRAGVCPRCGDPIAAGSPIAVDVRGLAVHARCPFTARIAAAIAPGPLTIGAFSIGALVGNIPGSDCSPAEKTTAAGVSPPAANCAIPEDETAGAKGGTRTPTVLPTGT